MGKKLSYKVDWSKDKGNSVGDVVMLAQHARTELGIVSFLGQAPLYEYHAELANQAFQKSFELHDLVLRLPINENTNTRFMSDDKLVSDIYKSGSSLVVNVYLLFEHLTLSMLISNYRRSDPATFKKFENEKLEEKLKHIIKNILGIDELLRLPGYGMLFSDLEKVRHALNHPRGTNIYSTDESEWDKVPIAWFVSGKHLNAFHYIVEFHKRLTQELEKHARSLISPGTITNISPIVADVYTEPKTKK